MEICRGIKPPPSLEIKKKHYKSDSYIELISTMKVIGELES